MTKGIDKATIEKATGKSWDQWLKFFESINAIDLTHQQIVRKVYDHMVETARGSHSEEVSVRSSETQAKRTNGTESASRKDSSGKLPESNGRVGGSADKQASAMRPSGWWAQNVTVAYEQHAGRRVPGQRNDGTFDVSVSKTLDGSMDDVFASWLKLVKEIKEFDGVKLEKDPFVSKTEKYRNWRAALDDGSRVVVGLYQKTPDKTMFPLAHEKLQFAGQAEEKRAFWKKFLEKL